MDSPLPVPRYAAYLREIIYGGTDGIITTFAVVAGFSGSGGDSGTIPVIAVLLFGIANLFADGISMGLGSYLSNSSEVEYAQRRLHNLHKKNSIDYYVGMMKHGYGFTREEVRQAAALLHRYPRFRAQFHGEVHADAGKPNRLILSQAMATFIAFVSFGSIPLLPYALFSDSTTVFMWAILMAAFALTLLGTLRFIVTRQSLFRSLIESIGLGGIAASVAYAVGVLFQGVV